MPDLKEWLERRSEERNRLYQQYGKPLEGDHSGEYAAISFSGETVHGFNSGEVLKRALDRFGRDNFVLARIGHRTFGRWLRLIR